MTPPASAYGHLPYFVVVDELAQWPATPASRALWEALVSGLPKRTDSRLAVLTTAGDPAHWSARVIDGARSSDRWHVSEVPGPLPWADLDDLAEQRRMLPASSYARLHLNEWTAGEDRLVDPDDLAACVTLDGPQDFQPGRRYVIGLDLGLKDDRTVLTVCHAERDGHDAPPRVILDRIHTLSGTPASPVQLADVEAVALEAARTYRAPIRVDPWQAAGLAQRLRGQGITVDEWTFSDVSVGRLAVTLHLLLREHRLNLPDDDALLDELANVRLREKRPGVFRLDHDNGHHDDQAVTLGLAALALTEKPDPGGVARINVPQGTIPPRGKPKTDTPGMPTREPRSVLALARTRARVMPQGMRGGPITGVPGAYDDPRGDREGGR